MSERTRPLDLICDKLTGMSEADLLISCNLALFLRKIIRTWRKLPHIVGRS
jgi:hypothetical protein